jgi:hypothetical protein
MTTSGKAAATRDRRRQQFRWQFQRYPDPQGNRSCRGRGGYFGHHAVVVLDEAAGLGAGPIRGRWACAGVVTFQQSPAQLLFQ